MHVPFNKVRCMHVRCPSSLPSHAPYAVPTIYIYMNGEDKDIVKVCDKIIIPRLISWIKSDTC